MPLRYAKPEPSARLVVIELDGALLRSDGSISTRTRGALHAVQARGVELVWVTARPPRLVRGVAANAQFTGIVICSHGSCTYELSSHTVRRQELLGSKHAVLMVESLRAAIPGVAFAVEVGLRYGCEPAYLLRREHVGSPSEAVIDRADATQLCRAGVSILNVQQDDWPLPELLGMTTLLGCTRTTVIPSGSSSVDVLARGVSNAKALEVYCSERNIAPAEVLAFGSARDDLAMLRWAGCGVAVASAHPSVLAAADVVTRSSDADGVAFALERLGYA